MDDQEKTEKIQQNETQMNEEGADPMYIVCPCCGKPTLTRPVKINDELLDHYMSCIISGVPFHRTYDIYGGKIRVTVTRLGEEMIEKLREASRILSAWEALLGDQATLCQDLNSELRLYCCVPTIVVAAGDTRKETRPEAAVVSACSAIEDTNKTIETFLEADKVKAIIQTIKTQLAILHDPATSADRKKHTSELQSRI